MSPVQQSVLLFQQESFTGERDGQEVDDDQDDPRSHEVGEVRDLGAVNRVADGERSVGDVLKEVMQVYCAC